MKHALALLALSLLLTTPSFADDNFPPIEAKPSGAKVVEVRREGDAVTVLLSRGKKHGVRLEDRFILLHAERRFGRAKVSVVFQDICVATLELGADQVKKGDVAVMLGRPRAKPKPGAAPSPALPYPTRGRAKPAPKASKTAAGDLRRQAKELRVRAEALLAEARVLERKASAMDRDLKARVRPVLGLRVVSLVQPGVPGVNIQVVAVKPGSPAQLAGILKGDLIRAIDGRPIASTAQLAKLVQPLARGEAVAVELERGDWTKLVVCNPPAKRPGRGR